ncbi:MAG TPA: acyl-CoA dehydrogenase family protein [Streptosporangiaceae bacterium]|jgi:alkylation response protein AidB-like acyl-CoA dehydrogenase
MSLATTTEQDQLRATVRRFLDDEAPVSRVREIAAAPYAADPGLWRRLAELGIQGLAVPAEYGGAGAGYQELAYVFEETGRALLPGPLLATLGLALPALLACGDADTRARYLPGIADGTVVATLAGLAPGGGWDSWGRAIEARTGPGGCRVSGAAAVVPDLMSATLLLVVAGTGTERRVVAVDPGDPSVRRAPVPTLDQTRALGTVELHDTPAVPVGGAGALSNVLDHADLLLAAEMVGGAQACLDMSVAYAKIREQFGRPIGSFQAVKHKCAEILVEIEGARAAARYAAWAAAENPAELPVVATLAKAAAGEAYFRAAADNVQIHGGIGFTWEHDAHLYFKRAKTAQLMFGDTGAYRRRLADRIGL